MLITALLNKRVNMVTGMIVVWVEHRLGGRWGQGSCWGKPARPQQQTNPFSFMLSVFPAMLCTFLLYRVLHGIEKKCLEEPRSAQHRRKMLSRAEKMLSIAENACKGRNISQHRRKMLGRAEQKAL